MDVLYINVNEAWLKTNGKKKEEVIRRRATEVFPVAKDTSQWLEPYARAALHGETNSFESLSPIMNRWHLTTIYSPKKDYFVAISEDITERKKAEEITRASEEIYRTLFDKIEDAFMLVEPVYDETERASDYVIIKLNESFQRQTGLKSGSVVGRRIKDVLPDVEHHWLDIVGRVGRTGVSEYLEDYNRNTDRWYDELVFKFGEARVGLLFKDVTEKKKAEEEIKEANETLEQKVEERTRELTESEEQLRKAIEDAPIPIIMQAEGGEVLQLSHAWTELTGYSMNEIRTFDEWITKSVYGEGANKVRDHLHQLFKGGKKSIDVEFSVWTSKGEERYWSFSASSPGALRDGRRFIVEMVKDVTDLKQAQIKIEEERRMLRTVLDNAPVGMGITDAKGGIILDNGILEKIWRRRLSLDSIVDYSQCKAFWPETGELVKVEEWPAARAIKGETSTETFDIEKFDGTRGALIVSATPIRDSDGRITGTVWTNQDISEIRDLELDLKRSNEELRQFAYVASHDLQEPLRMVTSYLGLLENKYADILDDRAKEYMGFAVEGGQRMRDLIDDLLSYTRVDSQGKPFTPVDMNAIASAVLKNLKSSIQFSNAQITIEDLPTINADGMQMAQLLQNLIGNAIKFCGGKRPEVRVSYKENWREYVFSVEDNGIGIDPEYQQRIFEMFYRLHCREVYEGTGIGLAVSKRIVERHGGRIWLESDGRNGSTFFFTIPTGGRTN